MDSITILILDKLSIIETKIDNIQKDVEIIKIQTSKMDQHVDFVNNIYETVEEPLNFVVNRWNSLFGVSLISTNSTNNNNKLLDK
jgi:glycerol-3-phosphate responsive antiterminator